MIEKILCSIHNSADVSFGNTGKEIYCFECIKNGKHHGHNLQGDIKKAIQDQRNEIGKCYNNVLSNLNKIKGNISNIKDYFKLKESSSSGCESKIFLYSSYFEKVNSTEKDLEDKGTNLLVLRDSDIKITSDYFKTMKEATQINSLLDESEKMIDLNSFVIQQRDESIPYKTEKFMFSVLERNLMKNSKKVSVKFKNGAYIINFKKLEDSNLLEIKFILSQRPGSWSHDLKISLYFKKENGIYEPVAKDCVMNTENQTIQIQLKL